MKTAEETSATKSVVIATSASPARTVAGFTIALSVPAVFLADTAAALLGGWDVESRLDRAAIALMLAWFVVAIALAIWPWGRLFYARRAPQLAALIISGSVAWIVGELAIGNVLEKVAEPFHLRRPGLEFTYRPEKGIMRDVGDEAHVRFNAWGVRGAELPLGDDVYRILCLGGSSTACTYLDDAKTWPHLLAIDLHRANPARQYWVGNAGLPGFRAAQHRQFAEQSNVMEHLDCLIVQAGINDFMACLAGPQADPPRWTGSRIWRLMTELARRYIQSGTLVEDKAATVYIRRRAMRTAAAIETSEPKLDNCLADFARSIDGIIDACQARGVRVVFTTQSVLWRDDLDAENTRLLWFGQMQGGRYLSVEQMQRGMRRYNEVLRSICAEREIELVDLSALDGDPSVFYDDCHFTETGAAHVAEIIAGALLAAHGQSEAQQDRQRAAKGAAP